MFVFAQSDFQLFGAAHNLVLILTVLVAVGLVKFAQRQSNEIVLKRVRWTMAGLLLLAVALDPVLTLRRYGTESFGWEMVVENSLPFFLCDVVSIVLAFALITKSQRLAEIGYLWGMAGTLQGLIWPALWFDWRALEFYAFFLEHSGVPIAAVFLVWGLRILPQKGALVRAIWWSLGYLGVVMAINRMISENYGYLSEPPAVPTPFDYMGPWPYYLITLQLIAYSMYAVLLRIAPTEKTALNRAVAPSVPTMSEEV